jgi:hypothetical protein
MNLINQLLESASKRLELSLLKDFDPALLEEMLADDNVELVLHNYEVGGLLEDALTALKDQHEKQAKVEEVEFKVRSSKFTRVGYIPAEERLVCDYFIQGMKVDHWAEGSVKIETTDRYHFDIEDYPVAWKAHELIELTSVCEAYYSAMG